jgi:hypothetical protein
LARAAGTLRSCRLLELKVDRLDLVDAARQFLTAKHRFESSITSGEVTLFGPASRRAPENDP